MSTNIIFIFTVLITAFSASLLFAAEPEAQFDDDSWLEDDSETRSLEVNEGELTFIEPVKDNRTLHSEKELTITESSLSTGWVYMKQCYFNISPIDETDIVYSYKQMRNFKIISSKNIGKASTDGQVVHLQDISAHAAMCVTAEVNVLDKRGADNFVINNGPYYQQFFDGYFPYHVSLTVNFPGELVRVSGVSPHSQPLFNVRAGEHQLSIDTWFEGILTIQIEFQRKLISNLIHFNKHDTDKT
ncbi:MAG: hypothetical protein LJE83_12470 [Gammaproteobacteria bacterium]|nr:hypothetical protein [Gammaproteobacteria bacterium]